MSLSLKSLLPSCLACDEPSLRSLCHSCLEDAQLKDCCDFCGTKNTSKLCCQKERSSWQSFQVAFSYRGALESYLHAIKKRGHNELLHDLPHLLSFVDPASWEGYDYLVCIPSDPWQTRQRGFDWGRDLGRKFSKITGIADASFLIRRRPFFCPASQLRRGDRERILPQLFERVPRDLRGKRILIVDDVLTTGTSMRIVRELLREDSAKLGYFCLARTLKSVKLRQ